MKRSILMVIALFVVVQLQAQFVLTDKGLTNAKHKGQDYYVIECPGRSQQAIFTLLAYFMESRYAYPWSQFNAIEPDSFAVSTFAPESVIDGKSLFRDIYDMGFQMMFDVRDGAVRVWAPVINSMSRETNVAVSVGTDVVQVTTPVKETTYLFVSTEYNPGNAKQYRSGSSSIYNKRGKLKKKHAKQAIETYFNTTVNSLALYLSNEPGNW